ncbi:hypothetical protein Halha_0559 [Halobacteroides halobius DSM 5150]|uniref:Uncharacterized protein n=1 Tax=Halobacteroides halobius (strain ATCC 35273 / DSM 5150 / MD-1) TaxID=748449 RepID=L0K8T7_HALHC|nr:hypothetical protein [Halobacteroides halobius]AGB40533.1 hypothetical protein Halha_0559 [Halobacteroides halobius DSM 5150]
MPNDNFELIQGDSNNQADTADQSNQNQGFLDNDLLLTLIILFIFFQRNDAFAQNVDLLNQQVKQVKTYLDTADSTLQALNQASQIPNQQLE